MVIVYFLILGHEWYLDLLKKKKGIIKNIVLPSVPVTMCICYKFFSTEGLFFSYKIRSGHSVACSIMKSIADCSEYTPTSH